METGGGSRRGPPPPSLTLLSAVLAGYVALAALGAWMSGRFLEPVPLLLTVAGWLGLAVGYAAVPSPPGWVHAWAVAAIALGALRDRPEGLFAVLLLSILYAALRPRLEGRLASSNPRSPGSYVPPLVMGLAAYLAGVSAFGLPLVQGAARSGAVSRIFGLSSLLLTSSVALSGSAPIAALSSALGLLTGFRSYAMLPALAWAASPPRRSDGGRRIWAFAGIVLVGSAALGALRGLTGEPDPLGMVDRVAFTYWVYEAIALVSLPLGSFHGSLLLSTDPRRTVARLFGRGVTRYTYFLMGQPVADFGLLAPLEMLALGVILRDAGEGSSGALALAYLTVAVETGIDPLVLGVTLACAYTSRVRAEAAEPQRNQRARGTSRPTAAPSAT